ncbi:unnamed protein product [Periconia digitata]|uniref:DOC domain-containing protein n=1 Tax=Periconia digitata TaxID=1303443 RepID=A0A9W4UJT1_9PLEO|nr:unnamed protein product [Periconia digitata]
MPPGYRRRAPPPPPVSPPEADPYSDSEEESVDEDAGEAEEELDELEEALAPDEDEEEVDDDDDDDGLGSPLPSPTLANNAPPPNFREISTLASWTVSSSKPGCSIPQLRHPSTSLFWQSDGPQPHYLNIHFFKLVRIVGLRLFLDFEADESYTPTRIVLLAGSGMNDLVEWGEMRLENPRGWIWADFEGVRDPESSSSDSSDFDSDDEDAMDRDDDNILFTTAPAFPTQPQNATTTPRNIAPEPRDSDQPSSDFENAAPPPPPQPIIQQQTPLPPPQTFTPANPTTTGTTLTPATATHTLARPSPRHPFTPLHPTTSSPPAHGRRRRTRPVKPPNPPLLRCHLLQIKILENHQNGKDTHLRGLQVFALDNERGGEAGNRRGKRDTDVNVNGEKRESKNVRENDDEEEDDYELDFGRIGGSEFEWGGEPVLR